MNITKPIKIAHRGAQQKHPENTLASFNAALASGFDAIELDIRTCKTGEIVVFHDENLKRLTGIDKLVSSSPLSQIKQARVQGEPIPLLKDVLTTLPKALLILELKDIESVADVVELVLNKQANLAHDIVLISKNVAALRALHKIDPEAQIPRGFVTNHHVFYPEKLMQQLRLNHLVLHHRVLSWFIATEAHKHETILYVYPVRSKLTERIIRRHRVDGIMYDSTL